MSLSQWFHAQLQVSADGFVWAAQQVPVERRLRCPPEGLGEWSAVRHVFHLWFYESGLALPGMRMWVAGGQPVAAGESEDAAWGGGQVDLDELLTRFKAVRAEQIALVSQFDEAAWDATRQTPWGTVTLRWVVSKTYQHTAEHTSDVLRIALFWDFMASRREAGSQAASEG